MNTYAAKVVDGTVTQVIVGTAAWASDRMGGEWADSDVKVGVGWAYGDGTFTQPAPVESKDGDATEQDWLDAVQAVKDTHPYPDAP